MRFEAGSLILVTGGAGFLGVEVVRQLLREGYRVRVLDDLSRGQRERLAGLDVELLVDDVRSERAAQEAVDGAAAIVHLAAPPPTPASPREERHAHEVTVTGTLTMCAAARVGQVARFVVGSSAAVYGRSTPQRLHEDLAPNPSTAEGAQKLAAEIYARTAQARDGLPVVILRLFSLYGAGQDGASSSAPFVARFVHQARTGAPITIFGDGLQTRDLLHVEDAARGIVASLTTPGITGRTLNVASGETTSVRQVLAILAEVAGQHLPPPRYGPARPGEPARVQASITAAATALGFRPQIRLRDGLRACWNASLAAPTAGAGSTAPARSRQPAGATSRSGGSAPQTTAPPRPASPPVRQPLVPGIAPRAPVPPPPPRVDSQSQPRGQSNSKVTPPPVPPPRSPAHPPPLPKASSGTQPSQGPARGYSLFADRPPSWRVADESLRSAADSTSAGDSAARR